MLRGGKIMFTAFLSYYFLGRRLQPYQIFGACLVSIGALVQYSVPLVPENPSSRLATCKMLF
eukprot:3452424-Amphidinium_carterae.1